MSDFELVSQYIDTAQKVTRLADLESETEAAIRELEFDYFAILHHLDRAYPGAPPALGQVRLSNYPSAWRETVQKEVLVSVDPVLMASQRTAHGFLWSQVPEMIDLTDRQRDVFVRAKSAGLGDGYTVPVHIPGEYLGSSSFSVRPGRDIRRSALPMLQYMASFAFEAGRRLSMRADDVDAVSLTDRQIDCIILAGRGATAREGAELLGIKQDTFQKHIADAKQRAGVHTTTQLVVRSLFDGRVTFKDLLTTKKNGRTS